MSNETKAETMKNCGELLSPKLRFPEFQDAQGWERTTIGALGRFYYGKSAPKWSLADDAPTPCVRYGELYTKFGPVITRTFSKTDIDPKTLRFSKGGEILIPRVGERPEDFGRCCAYLPLKDIAIGEMISVLETEQNPLFYTYYFRSIYKQFAKVVEGQNVKNLYFTELEPLPIYRPSIPEQQKIADCLTSVDDLIIAQTQKVDVLKTHQKGLVQQLFPREGETQPQVRFRDFQDAGPWEVKTLGSIASFSSGGTPSKDNPKYWNGTIPWVSASSMYDLVIKKADHYVTPGAIGNGTRIAKKGSVLILVRGSMLFKRVPICLAGMDVAFNQDVKALHVDESVDNRFLLHQLSAFQSRIPINETGIGAGKIEADHLKNFEVFLPEEPEQHRIADCLTSLNDLIDAHTQKLYALNALKMGLMQQLFPSAEGV